MAAGFAASTPFLRGFLDKWHIKPLGFAREEYKSVVSQYTDREYSRANREATTALLHGWMGQIITDVAAARGMTTAQVPSQPYLLHAPHQQSLLSCQCWVTWSCFSESAI